MDLATSQCLLFGCLLVFYLPIQSNLAAAAELKSIYGVVDGTAYLPCNITPPMRNDSVRLVLWYKDSKPQPVYSFDSRFSTVKHWSEDQSFGPRTYFRDSSVPAQLIISHIEASFLSFSRIGNKSRKAVVNSFFR